MTSEQVSKLERLRYHGTLYEVVLRNETGARYLVGYTRKTGTGLRQHVSARGEAIYSRCGLPATAAFTFGVKSITGHGWTIEFTGRTEREAIVAGEIERA